MKAHVWMNLGRPEWMAGIAGDEPFSMTCKHCVLPSLASCDHVLLTCMNSAAPMRHPKGIADLSSARQIFVLFQRQLLGTVMLKPNWPPDTWRCRGEDPMPHESPDPLQAPMLLIDSNRKHCAEVWDNWNHACMMRCRRASTMYAKRATGKALSRSRQIHSMPASLHRE